MRMLLPDVGDKNRAPLTALIGMSFNSGMLSS
jgi:hypothetical protein